MSEVKAVPAQFKSEAFLKKITLAAQAAQSSLPTAEELASLDEATQGLYSRIASFLEGILAPSEWTDERLQGVAKESGWVHTSLKLAAAAHTTRTRGLTPAITKGGGVGTVNDCASGYDACNKENGCKYTTICICCIPCSLAYAMCMKKVLTAAQAPIATLINLSGTWASGGAPGPVIAVTGNSLSVDMSAYKRPLATGYITDSSDIVVNFPDDRAYSAKLQQPNTIHWSNNSVWSKV